MSDGQSRPTDMGSSESVATSMNESELAVGVDAFVADGDGLEVAIVGAGAIGATAAYDLARRGADVTLYDRGSVASGSSGRAAGVCYNAFADSLDAEIGTESIERFRSLSGEETFPFTECPYVWLAREGDERRAAAIRAGITRMLEEGVIAAEMDAEELGERFPALYTDDVAVAGVAGAAGYTDPARYTACLAAAATGMGATLESDTPVTVRADPPRVRAVDAAWEREFDAVLVAAGAHTRRVFAAAEVPIAMKPYRVQALTAAGPFPEPMCYDATDGFYVRPHPNGLLAGNGTEEVEVDPDEYDRDANPGFADELCARVRHRLPSVDIELERAWAGLCTATPDGDPLVGEIRDDVYVATGFQGHGFMRAPAIGERLATQIVGGEGIEAFDPRRFSGDEEFEIVEGMRVDDPR